MEENKRYTEDKKEKSKAYKIAKATGQIIFTICKVILEILWGLSVALFESFGKESKPKKKRSNRRKKK